MCNILKITVTALRLIAGALVYSHPATERYIPIGESPGVSNVKSYVGAIRSIRTTASGFTMSVEDSDKLIEVTEDTKIYLDTGSAKTNSIGAAEDCKVGRRVEVYLHEDGTAYWVKISVP